MKRLVCVLPHLVP
jgi:hypothetical protein